MRVEELSRNRIEESLPLISALDSAAVGAVRLLVDLNQSCVKRLDEWHRCASHFPRADVPANRIAFGPRQTLADAGRVLAPLREVFQTSADLLERSNRGAVLVLPQQGVPAGVARRAALEAANVAQVVHADALLVLQLVDFVRQLLRELLVVEVVVPDDLDVVAPEALLASARDVRHFLDLKSIET